MLENWLAQIDHANINWQKSNYVNNLFIIPSSLKITNKKQSSKSIKQIEKKSYIALTALTL